MSMPASHFTIYKLNTKLDPANIIEEFNEDKEPQDHFIPKKNNPNKKFKNIKDYQLYIREGINKPDWKHPLKQLVTDLGSIENVNYSYVLFVEVANDYFAITGGSGYHVINKYKQYNFGIEVLSRLIDPSDSVIKRVNDRYLTGNLMGSNLQFLGNVSINSEKNINTFFEEIYIALSSEIIQDKLGITINTRKKDYRFLATDSIKLGKAISLNELDRLLESITDLLDQSGYSINPFYMLNNNDPKIEKLDKKLVDNFISYLRNPKESNLNIISFYFVYDEHYILIASNKKFPYENERDIVEYFNQQVSLDKDKENLLKVIKNIELIGVLNGEVETTKTLYEHIDIKIQYQGKTYWLFEGNWQLIELSFMDHLNETFVHRVTNNYNHNFNLNQIKRWPEGIKEGEFNFNHNNIDSVYVLDKILHNNIEICDLLIEDREENKLYFVHIKDGLDGEIRVLSAQVEQAIQLINNAEFDDNELPGYYNSIINKIGNETNGKETEQSISARKFMKRFKTENEFVEAVTNMDKTFVFAYRPLDSHDFNNPKSIQSTAAKLSMIDLTNIERSYDIPIKFMKILN